VQIQVNENEASLYLDRILHDGVALPFRFTSGTVSLRTYLDYDTCNALKEKFNSGSSSCQSEVSNVALLPSIIEARYLQDMKLSHNIAYEETFVPANYILSFSIEPYGICAKDHWCSILHFTEFDNVHDTSRIPGILFSTVLFFSYLVLS